MTEKKAPGWVSDIIKFSRACIAFIIMNWALSHFDDEAYFIEKYKEALSFINPFLTALKRDTIDIDFDTFNYQIVWTVGIIEIVLALLYYWWQDIEYLIATLFCVLGFLIENLAHAQNILKVLQLFEVDTTTIPFIMFLGILFTGRYIQKWFISRISLKSEADTEKNDGNKNVGQQVKGDNQKTKKRKR